MVEGTSPSIRLVETIADIEGVDPIELDFVLAEAIDPHALDALLDHDGEPIVVEFTVGGHEVVATDTELRVDDSVTVLLD
ncbi:HalOD1 output domain-containing protein [Halomicroarcula sp. GCM10025709]|uniref:HalOD1 output domain-containing protein n=1 Tax=Haloarcula TaxID=2237 RepID=UPI0024C3152F|nr:HalOD1 output domain-containing protein [Halomicroarcula sp. YJ-61-S]